MLNHASPITSAKWNYTVASSMSFKTRLAWVNHFSCRLLLMDQLELHVIFIRQPQKMPSFN